MKKLIITSLALSFLISGKSAVANSVAGQRPVVQIAIAKVKPGTEVAFKTAVARILVPTRSEPGSLSYQYVQSTDDPTEFIFIEVWKSVEAINIHMNSSFLKRFFGEVGPLFEPGYPILKKYTNAER